MRENSGPIFEKLKNQKLQNHIETDFGVTPMFKLAQRGLPTPYRQCDYFAITQPVTNITEVFFKDMKEHYLRWNTNSKDHCVIFAFSADFWNKFNTKNKIDPPQHNSSDNKNLQDKYKYNLTALIILKKKAPTAEAETVRKSIDEFLTKSKFSYEFTHGTSQASGEAEDSVIGGRFNDNVEVPKDPITFALHALIGFENAAHLGGSYVMAQKIDLDWEQINIKNKHLQSIVGRIKIEGNPDNDSSIISQNWCPHSHIKHTRVKDEFGNPISMARQSKTYFYEEPIPGQVVNEKGVFFIGYINSWKNINKMIDNQMSRDGLMNFFKTSLGNILYVPNVFELGVQYRVQKNCSLKELCSIHNIDWSNHFPGISEPSHSPYLFYSRNQYMQRMALAHGVPEDQKLLDPPTPRTLRILSKTFALWQDTWYYDRRQMEMGHLQTYLSDKYIPKEIKQIAIINTEYEKISIPKRQALAVYVELAHILSTTDYGCRGPNKDGKFGAGTFHIEPEDVLAGGQANLTFGQGKHLLDYLTQEQRDRGWMSYQNLSQHSGVGHIVPYMDEAFKVGLQGMIKSLLEKKIQIISKNSKKKSTKSALSGQEIAKRVQLYECMIISLRGMQIYLRNYAQLCRDRASLLKASQQISKKNLEQLAKDLDEISVQPPKTFRQGAQLALSTFICLHITGQPVSLGRLDQHLANLIDKTYDPNDPTHRQKFRFQQEVIDSFWIKVGQKVNLNKSFFEDHQKWGNLAMGGSSMPYPQGGSFNQWGHQVTVGGFKRDLQNGQLQQGYNACTMLCLKASRRLPLNAPCLGLRVDENIPQIYVEEAAKAILSGGAHPILLNDHRAIKGLEDSGKYKIPQSLWSSHQSIEANYNNFDCTVESCDARDYSSDGCYQFLLSGKCWFCLSGLPVLQPLELVLNEGKDLLNSGTRYIHGQRNHYKLYPLAEIQNGTWEDFEEKYFDFFKTTVTKNFTFQLQNFGKLSSVFPTSLLNSFTGGLAERGKDFYSNGTKYNLFCPQYTGVSNLVNALWNIKKYVFEQRTMTLQRLRLILLNNWGKTLTEPFVPNNLPQIQKDEFVKECEFWRMKILASEEKFGLNKQVSDFGHRIAKKLAQKTIQIFSNPQPETLHLLKRLTKQFGDENAKFGLQVQPGCGTFENYQDNGIGCGPSFDGRLRSESLAQDMSLQPYFNDEAPLDRQYKFSNILKNVKNPNFWSGSVLDFNIDEDFNEDKLIKMIHEFAKNNQDGPNVITVTTCDRSNLEELARSNHKDLIRLRMGGWTEFGVAMFPELLKHHIRRIRTYDS